MKSDVLSLLTTCSRAGIKLILKEENLVLQIPKGDSINESLLTDMKTFKSELIEYLKDSENETSKSELLISDIPFIAIDQDKYYEITSVENYWVDDRIDSEYKQKDSVHGVCHLLYEITGDLDLDLLRTAIKKLIQRHESLRSTFHFLNGRYLMRIENGYSPLYNLEIMDLLDQNFKTQDAGSFIYFVGHKFNVSQGPLFIPRAVREKLGRTILSIKGHHVIMDTWSIEIIMRDLMLIYKALSDNTILQLPILEHQLKEHLSYSNRLKEKNYRRDREYWKNLYTSLPEELIIPIPNLCAVSESSKLLSIEFFEFEREIYDLLQSVSTKHSTTLFVVLQASFKSFLFKMTQQKDITIGTYVFGRDYTDAEDQIGCFAKTVLIRTIFDRTASFGEIINQVKKSNEDMRIYNAYSLRDTFQEMIEPESSMHGSFWKINLQFHNIAQGVLGETFFNERSNEGSVKFSPRPTELNSHIQLDMHLNFTRSSTALSLFVEFDGSLYALQDLRNFISDYSLHLNEFACGALL